MGPPSYMQSVVGRNVVIRRMSVLDFSTGSAYVPRPTDIPGSRHCSRQRADGVLCDAATMGAELCGGEWRNRRNDE